MLAPILIGARVDCTCLLQPTRRPPHRDLPAARTTRPEHFGPTTSVLFVSILYIGRWKMPYRP